MIDLDPSLRRAQERSSATWGEERMSRLAEAVAERLRLTVEYEPPDEEWALLQGTHHTWAMLSVRLPLALVRADAVAVLQELDPAVVVVVIEKFDADDLRASADLLRTTVLPHGWDPDFDTEAFCASDLFVESV